MLKNLTLTLDDKLLQWARVWAAEQGVSISRAVSELLSKQMQQDHAYAEAMTRYLAGKTVKSNGPRRWTREQIYDRPILRRH